MTLKVEGVVNGGMHAEETLGRSSRFEPLHLALSSPYRLVRVLGPIVAFVGDVEPALGKEIFDVAVAEREAQVEPDGMLDDYRWKPVTAV